jgi:hypothetical protein
MFLQLSRIGLFGANRAYIHFEKPNLPGVLLSKITQFSQGNNVLAAPPSNTDGCFSRDTCGSSRYLNRPIWKKMSLSSPENSICMKYFFQKTSQFSQGTNVLDAAASKIDYFLWLDTWVSSHQLNSPICSKQSLSPL